ncbi:hypothetical protein [Aetokthonos hydrillicola]|uniref:hypothetical protein n=1 Tax=Aetokthonos hydrillicola TaxID=1550245 RepID=UPI001ABB6031|nr:hypothetical protein [Aetokthonos hydrillicola]MBO3461819.1 hypothetical protein [Aetokthonos hydrillicola CCALA 1050]
MFTPASSTSADLAIALLIHYSFDLSGYSANELVNIWHKQFSVDWLHLAVIEALYQGRYKAVSVQQILIMWHRRGQATFHFNMEFERLICSKFPQSLTLQSSLSLPPVPKNTPREEFKNSSSSLAINPASNKLSRALETSEEKLLRSEVRPSPRLPLSSQSSSPPLPQRLKLPASSRSSIPNNEALVSPPTTNHPPIGQFTPQTTKRSESFTSKLQALSHDRLN